MYLLDTNIISALSRDPHGPLRDRIRDVGEDQIATSIIVAAEVRFGMVKKGSNKLSRQLDVVLSALEILPWESPLDEVYAEIRAHLEARGQKIGANDTLIAAHAVGLDATLVTDNAREFARVPQLRHENWLTDPA